MSCFCGWLIIWIDVVLRRTVKLFIVTDVSTTCVEVIFRVRTYTQFVEMSVTTSNSLSQDYTNPENQPTTNIDSPGLRPFTVLNVFMRIKSHPFYSHWVVPENIRTPTTGGILEFRMNGGFFGLEF